MRVHARTSYIEGVCVCVCEHAQAEERESVCTLLERQYCCSLEIFVKGFFRTLEETVQGKQKEVVGSSCKSQ